MGARERRGWVRGGGRVISDEDKERVRQATDIVQLVGETVELRQRGREFWGCCPFHHEKTPSFKVDPATGLWHCFGACSEGGDVFKYVMKRENLSFPDSIRYLADRAGIELTEDRGAARGPRKNRLIEALTLADDYYHTMLMRGRGEGPAAARAYLAGRGFGSDVCRRWHLGYAPGRGALVAYLRGKGFSPKELIAANLAVERSGRLADWFYDRAMFPIHDERGRTIAFGGRILRPANNAPKYLNTRDTTVFNKGKHLFAYDRAKETMAATGTAVVCEGYTDVIAMHEAGFTSAVAALGTAFRLDHIRLMERQRVSRIICMFDGDEAGQRAAERAVQFIDKTSASMLCVVLPDGQDPMEFLSSHDAAAMQAQLDAAVPLMDFVFSKRLAGYDLSAPGRRVKALDEMAQLLAPLKHSVLLDEYATHLADALGMDVAETKRVIREKPVKAAEPEPQRRREGATAAAVAPAAPSAGVPFASDEDGYVPVPDDYVPADAYEGAGVTPAAAAPAPGAPPSFSRMLSGDERMQVAVERELLSMLAAMPDEVRPYADRLADVMWADGRHEGMAWAMLATPEGSAPADAVAAAALVEPDATQILSSGRVVSSPGMDVREKVEFLVDSVELYSCKRRVREIKARLRQAGDAGDRDAEALFERATSLQKRINVLTKKLSAVVEQ